MDILSKPVASGPEPTVFIVDDDEPVRDSMRVLLETYGMTVKDFPSAADFLAGVPGHSDGCLILDNHMPGMSGLELLDMLRAWRVSIPVIMVTGGSDPTLKDRALRAGAVVVLDKPVDEDILVAAIKNAAPERAN